MQVMGWPQDTWAIPSPCRNRCATTTGLPARASRSIGSHSRGSGASHGRWLRTANPQGGFND